ncbi:hypothetical protein [Cupriavidus pauculus]|uniref:hypothetical protein n=1 Tax=Cupriavidus pauculus TaxID=82633 RepID=UPI001EE2FCE7|nr:hypothetical protein [Cupriavidus pauculus]GJG96330.1 hypothetical protein CBA19C6_17595 [Cupriavidus pauculus]
MTWGEFDAHLRRFDERLDQPLERIDARFAAMDKRAAATEKRIEQLSGEMNRGFDRLSAEMDRGFRLERERVDVQFAALHERQREHEVRFTEQLKLNREEFLETRRETRSLKWNIWIAASATAVALASLNATMTSGIISAFESGRNMAAASAAQVDRTTTPQRKLPLHRREDAGDTLEDNQPQS